MSKKMTNTEQKTAFAPEPERLIFTTITAALQAWEKAGFIKLISADRGYRVIFTPEYQKKHPLITPVKDNFNSFLKAFTSQTATDKDTATTTALFANDNNINNNQEKKRGEKRFTKPSVEEIALYCLERKNGVSAQNFFDFYESKGWRVGKAPMKDWRAAVRTWEQRGRGIYQRESAAQAADKNISDKLSAEQKARDRELKKMFGEYFGECL
jgi:hypothetical protein